MSDNYQRAIRVTRVIDGDTVVADVDLGYHVTATGVTYRVARINAPEMTGAAKLAGRASQEYAHEWVFTHEHHGASLFATSTKTDDWRRYIAEITCGDGHNLSDDMLADGQAVVYK